MFLAQAHIFLSLEHIYKMAMNAMAKIKSKNFNEKSSRHIELMCKILCKLISTGIITLSFIRSTDNIADPFTKVCQLDKS